MQVQGEALRTLLDLVERNARLHGDTLFQVFGDKRQTYREYAVRARRLASALHAGGLKVQDRVGLLGMNCAEYLEIYGVSEVAPFILAPVNFRLAAPEILYILRDCGADGAVLRAAVRGHDRGNSRPAAWHPPLHLLRGRCARLGRRLRGRRCQRCAGRAGPRGAVLNTCTRSFTRVARRAGPRAR